MPGEGPRRTHTLWIPSASVKPFVAQDKTVRLQAVRGSKEQE